MTTLRNSDMPGRRAAARLPDLVPVRYSRMPGSPFSSSRGAAACQSADPDLFFPISDCGPAEEQTAKAKAICATCRIRRECLAFALRTEQTYGIWGGSTEHERAAMRRRAAREQLVTNERRLA
jgi:WhiB family transcriptional regulator, redox-sensing transcriptional regulator